MPGKRLAGLGAFGEMDDPAHRCAAQSRIMIRYTAPALLASLGFAASVSGRTSEPTGPEPNPSRHFSDVTLATGVRLRYAEQGDPGGPAVILLHGYSDSWFSWSRVLPLIPPRSHVIAPDLRGHGDSDKPPGGYATRDFTHDVLTSLRLPAGVWHRLMTGMLATPPAPELARVRIPTLIVSGDRDAVFTRAAQQALIAQLPQSRSAIYPETGHAPHWERPERFARDLVAFLGVEASP